MMLFSVYLYPSYRSGAYGNSISLVCRYSITYGNPYPPVFSIVPDTGQLKVVRPLDRDVAGGAEYNLRVKATDQGAPSLNSLVSVKVVVEDVNDNAPIFDYETYR